LEGEFGARFAEALAYATETHHGQERKGTDIPYVAHLLGVAANVLDAEGTEDEAIAGLLHDAAEDQGGKPRLDEIRERFGDRVADIVAVCSDTLEDPKPPWRPRKEAFIERFRGETDTGILRVEVADKLDNARAILRDYRRIGDQVWGRFTAGKDEQLWYYRSMVDALHGRLDSYMADDLARVVSEIEELAGTSDA
jgi:(p)ppGpp synthase/HD superfamily hydrolase